MRKGKAMAGGSMGAVGVAKERAKDYKGKVTSNVIIACIVVATGGSLFGYDIGISVNQKPKQGNYRPGSAHGNYHGLPNRYVEDGRPESGCGYERRMRVPAGVESVSVVSNSPRSSGSRPS